MFTKNIFAWLASPGTSERHSICNVTNTSGTKQILWTNGKSVNVCDFGTSLHKLVTALNGNCVMIGTGSTPPTRNDYHLESPITSGITITNGTITTVRADDDRILMAANYTVQNNVTEDLVISEIGAFANVTGYEGATTSQGTVTVTALMERTVFDTPVTIPTGESRIIQYVIRIGGLV